MLNRLYEAHIALEVNVSVGSDKPVLAYKFALTELTKSKNRVKLEADLDTIESAAKL